MLAFKPDVEMIKVARDYVAEIAAEWPVDGYHVRVVVSELVTNAIRHARTDEIRVDAGSDGDVHAVKVWDGDGTLPVSRAPGPDAVGGRGLVIVGELVSRWGALRDVAGGKTVFAEWGVRPPKTPPQRRRPPVGGEPVIVDGWDFGAGQLLTPGDVATMFRVEPKTVTRWADGGKLASIRTLGGVRRFSRQQVEHLMFGDGVR
ncbi:BldC family transcriptional regulator [Actinomadura sp. GC306]|nr:BldC family transcriptional regulator [Actinomadura sp. GC306]